MNTPRVSVVVCTYNRGAHLGHTLRGLTALDYPAFEIVVVNGPSTDDTAEHLEAWRDQIKITECPEANLSRARNAGIAQAAGDVIAFLDDDAIPHPRWLSALVRPYTDPRTGGAGGYTIDHTGARWQCRKTVCDRFGGARHMSPHFDVDPLNRPQSPFYPSLLGTNSSFRASALRAIGGFDDTFAYLLDETDVCLRIVDAGHRIVYVPDAVIFHQFAASHIRDPQRVPRTLYPSAVSKAYFVNRHGARLMPERAQAALSAYEREIREANGWLRRAGRITGEHESSLNADLGWGITEGTARARAADQRPGGSLPSASAAPPSFRAIDAARAEERLRVAFVSRAYPPAGQDGIARWTASMAAALAARGHEIHVLAEAEERRLSYANGIWEHRFPARGGAPEALAEQFDLPPGPAAWAAAVGAEMTRLRAFGIDIASAPIWDLEGIGCGAVLPTCLSLHTTYALAHPSKPDWALRPIYRHAHVDRMIAAERRMLANAPMILANSAAIVGDIEEAYGVTLKGRYTVVHHGTADPGEGPVRDDGAPMMLFASRFEQRKGFDLALFAADRLLQRHPSARVVFAGDALDEERRALLEGLGLSRLTDTPRVDWAGKLSREALDGLMRRADVVLFPSRYESFGLVLIEAFAAGTPVIALDTPSAREVLGPTGKAGVLIEAGPGTPGQEPWITGGALGDAAVELLTHPQRLARMKASARERFQTAFTLEAMGAAGEAFFHRHLARVQGTKTAEGHAGGIGIKGVA